MWSYFSDKTINNEINTCTIYFEQKKNKQECMQSVCRVYATYCTNILLNFC